MRIKILMSLLLVVLMGCTSEVIEPEVISPEVPVENESERLARLQAEYDANEALRKEALGSLYVPLPSFLDEPVLETEVVKALYVTFNVAGMGFDQADIDTYAEYITTTHNNGSFDMNRLASINRLEEILGIAQATEINSLVIDIKDDRGLIGWPSDVQMVNDISANWYVPWTDPEVLLNYCEEEGIYTIARIVAFKDPHFAISMPEHAIQLANGSDVYVDKSGFSWVNPFDQVVWDYNIAIAQEAALRGFDEIQYDYVRFPDNAKYYNPIALFPGRNDQDKDEAIAAFLRKAKAALEPYKVHLAADVFGVITHSWDDSPEDIGQTWLLMAPVVDYICPMVYPSHYGAGFYGFATPDAYPYEIIRESLRQGIEKNAALKSPAIIRPWLQGFTANWVKGYIEYDEDAIQAQIKALYDVGLEEYIIWMSSNRYLPQTFFTQDYSRYSGQEGLDQLGRSAEDALRMYLDAQISNRLSIVYVLTPLNQRDEDFDVYTQSIVATDASLKSYAEVFMSSDENGYVAFVNASYQKGEETLVVEEAKYLISLENGIYKITEAVFE